MAEKEAKPTFWCFEKTGPPSQKYNSWRWDQNTAQLQLPPLDLCENRERTRFRTMRLCELVSTLWICVKVQIHWTADPSFRCQRNTLPTSNLTLPSQLTPAVLTLLNKSWTKLSGDSQRRLRTAEPLFDERELEFRATDKSDNPTSGASPILSGLRGGLYPFDWRCRTLSRLFLSRNLGSPCLNISRLIWRGSCNVI